MGHCVFNSDLECSLFENFRAFPVELPTQLHVSIICYCFHQSQPCGLDEVTPCIFPRTQFGEAHVTKSGRILPSDEKVSIKCFMIIFMKIRYILL